MRWIIAISSDDDGAWLSYFNGTDDEAKNALLDFVKKDKEENEKDWYGGSENLAGIWSQNGSYYAYNTFDDYGVDYCIRPLKDIKTYMSDLGGTII